MAVQTAGSNGTAAPAQTQAQVPFTAGTYEYSEPITSPIQSVALGTNQQQFTIPITPGGFLRGVSLNVTSSGGTLGSGVAAQDFPWCVLANCSLETINGANLLYPMSGYAAYCVSKFCRPWDGDPAADPDFSASGAAPAFNLRYFVESRMTIGCVPNTDSRAQYRLRLTIASISDCYTTAPTTPPNITVGINLETYAQPQASDYAGNTIAQLPDGLSLQRFVDHQVVNVNGAAQTIQSTLVGNLIRCLIFIVRGATAGGGAGLDQRVALTADPLTLRLDNTNLVSGEPRARRRYENDRFYQFGEFQAPTSAPPAAVPTGVYVYPRWHDPGAMDGPYWLPTTTASYLAWIVTGAPAGGTVEIITESLAPTGPVPPYLAGL